MYLLKINIFSEFVQHYITINLTSVHVKMMSTKLSLQRVKLFVIIIQIIKRYKLNLKTRYALYCSWILEICQITYKYRHLYHNIRT